MKHKTFISNGIPHYLIDIVSPKANYNAAIFKKDADRIIEYIIKRGKLPIICGGTGFWIKSIVDDVVYPEVKPDWKLRSQLQSKPVEELFKMLEKLDSRRAKGIDKKNKVRLIRAIEICKILGKVPKSDKSNLKLVISNLDKKDPNYQLPVTNYQFLQLGIKLSKEKLHKNIKKRLEQRFRAGMIEEVTKLHKQGLSWKKIQSFGLGYYWIPQYLQNKLSYEELFEKVYQAEKDYAKRQMTWFRKDKRIKWVEKFRDIIREVDQFLK